jgi:hypothetical protein
MKIASAASGEAFTALRDWRPISAALSIPRSVLLCSGEERLPFHHTRPEGHQDNRVSIGKTTKGVNPNWLWKYDPFRFLLSAR